MTTSLLGEQLGGVKPGSVTGMIKKLAEMNLVRHKTQHAGFWVAQLAGLAL